VSPLELIVPHRTRSREEHHEKARLSEKILHHHSVLRGNSDRPAQTFKTLLVFDGANGSTPDTGALVQGANGNLYGTTFLGGANGLGTVFEVTAEGKLTTLYSFCSLPNCADGAAPGGGLFLATDGDFYGTTRNGGTTTNVSRA
jgi:uncharacterized repeat protein (TIGR03803 family)